MNRTATHPLNGNAIDEWTLEALLEGFYEKVKALSVGLCAGDNQDEYWIAGIVWGNNDATRILAHVTLSNDDTRLYCRINDMLADVAQRLGLNFINMR